MDVSGDFVSNEEDTSKNIKEKELKIRSHFIFVKL